LLLIRVGIWLDIAIAMRQHRTPQIPAKFFGLQDWPCIIPWTSEVASTSRAIVAKPDQSIGVSN
jgi:hypothetical protein